MWWSDNNHARQSSLLGKGRNRAIDDFAVIPLSDSDKNKNKQSSQLIVVVRGFYRRRFCLCDTIKTAFANLPYSDRRLGPVMRMATESQEGHSSVPSPRELQETH